MKLIKSDPNMNNRDKIFDEFTQYYALQNMLENERRFCCQSVREAVFETQSYFISWKIIIGVVFPKHVIAASDMWYQMITQLSLTKYNFEHHNSTFHQIMLTNSAFDPHYEIFQDLSQSKEHDSLHQHLKSSLPSSCSYNIISLLSLVCWGSCSHQKIFPQGWCRMIRWEELGWHNGSHWSVVGEHISVNQWW